MEPKPVHPEGPRLWFGGRRISPFIIRRIVEHGHGFHPFGQPDAAQMQPLRAALASAGRSLRELEVVGGLRPTFTDARRAADVHVALEQLPWQIEQGYTTICFNPSQYVDDLSAVPPLCHTIVDHVEALTR